MISVIIPVYNVERYIRQSIESIIHQTYDDLDIILIDDGSTDRSGIICEEYAKTDSRIKVIHTENHGLSAARNLGLKEAKGDYIGFIDADDWIEADMYRTLLKEMEKETGCDICVCGVKFEYENESVIPNLVEATYNTPEQLYALIDGKISFGVWDKLYRKDLFTDISFPEGMCHEDLAIMHLLFSKAKTVSTISYVQYHYRQRASGIARTHSAQNLMDCARVYISRYYYFMHEQPKVFLERKSRLIKSVAGGISVLWRWWHGCSRKDKYENKEEIRKLKHFIKNNIPLFGCPGWPLTLKVSTVFMHSDNAFSFAVLYLFNQVYRRTHNKRKIWD